MATTMSAEDEAKVKSLSEQWKQQKASGADNGVLDSIHSQAENIKGGYGYSGGADGTGYVPLSATAQSAGAAPKLATSTSQDQYLKEMYAAQEASAKSQLEAAYKQNVAALNATAAKIPETYNTARNQTAASSEQNRMAFNEQAAASGINSGAGSQANLAMGNTLTSNLGALNKQEAGAITDINTQRAELESSYNTQIAQAVASNNIARAQALYSEKVRIDESLAAQLNNQAAMDMQYKQYNDSAAASRADALASVGDFSGYQALYGLSDSQVKAFTDAYVKKNTKTYSGGGGGGSGYVASNTPVDNTTLFGDTTTENMSPLDIIEDIGVSRQEGYTTEQIKANATAAHSAGQLTDNQYQLYLQYAGNTKSGTGGGGSW